MPEQTKPAAKAAGQTQERQRPPPNPRNRATLGGSLRRAVAHDDQIARPGFGLPAHAPGQEPSHAQSRRAAQNGADITPPGAGQGTQQQAGQGERIV